MFERFTDGARRVLALANQEALRFNHEYIGTEHILLGLVKEGLGVGPVVLKHFDVDLPKARAEVEKLVQRGPEPFAVGKLPQTPRAKKVIEFAIEESRSLNHTYVGTEHLLLGILREQDGVAALILLNLGLRLQDVRQEVLSFLGVARASPEVGVATPGHENVRAMLSLRNVRKTFGAIVAVDGLTLLIKQGEVFGLLGPNGAGKTTTVNMAVGLLRPDQGTIEIDGVGSPDQPDVRAKIGVATQALALYDDLTGEENLSFFGKLQGLAGRRLAERVAWALEFVALADRRRDRVKTYSGGMKRRLNMAIAVIHDPPLLLLDEPTVGVDPQSRNAIFENILALRQQGRTVVYTTHYMEEAQRLCDRVGIIDHGRLLALDTVDRLIAAHGGRSILIADRGDGEMRVETDEPLAELLRLQKEGPLQRFRVERPDLERVFLHLTGRELRDA